jgi:hypothetical protein
MSVFPWACVFEPLLNKVFSKQGLLAAVPVQSNAHLKQLPVS